MIKGHGIDIVSVDRVRHMHAEHRQRFLDRCFTTAEQAYCARSEKRYFEHLAGRFAVKEAILKVLGTGWRGGIQWTDMEVLPNELGQPFLTLSGEAAKIATERGIKHWHVSISHIETHATGSAIGEG
jgi:holo-[acyl-carrier protein] synthase